MITVFLGVLVDLVERGWCWSFYAYIKCCIIYFINNWSINLKMSSLFLWEFALTIISWVVFFTSTPKFYPGFIRCNDPSCLCSLSSEGLTSNPPVFCFSFVRHSNKRVSYNFPITYGMLATSNHPTVIHVHIYM